MDSNFSRTNGTFEDFLSEIPTFVYFAVFFILLCFFCIFYFYRYYLEEEYLATLALPTTTAPTQEVHRLSLIDETPELLINPESTPERKKILGTIRGQLFTNETSSPMTAGASTSNTPRRSTSQIEQPIPLAPMRQSLSLSTSITFSPRKSARLSGRAGNVDEEQVTDSSQPPSSRSLEELASPQETPKKRQSLRLLEKHQKDKGE